jgi:hypothetical protein
MMKQYSVDSSCSSGLRREARRNGLLCGALAPLLSLVLLGLSACALEVQNTQPVKQLAKASRPPGSIYGGWRLYSEKCAHCHGPAAAGTTLAPDLLPIVREMGPHQFVNLVLRRYDWGRTLERSNSADRETLIEEILLRQDYPLPMPAWESEPSVNVHIVDFYAYLSARAQGLQDPQRPSQ